MIRKNIDRWDQHPSHLPRHPLVERSATLATILDSHVADHSTARG